MKLDRSTAGKRITKPLLLLWMILALAFMVLTVWDLYAPSAGSPVARFLKHRVNLESPEWKAALAAEAEIPAQSTVLVETDNRIFFFILRYHLYPAWVVTERELASWKGARRDLIDHLVSYRGGKLEVTEVKHQ